MKAWWFILGCLTLLAPAAVSACDFPTLIDVPSGNYFVYERTDGTVIWWTDADLLVDWKDGGPILIEGEPYPQPPRSVIVTEELARVFTEVPAVQRAVQRGDPLIAAVGSYLGERDAISREAYRTWLTVWPTAEARTAAEQTALIYRNAPIIDSVRVDSVTPEYVKLIVFWTGADPEPACFYVDAKRPPDDQTDRRTLTHDAACQLVLSLQSFLGKTGDHAKVYLLTEGGRQKLAGPSADNYVSRLRGR
ncbi:MAG: hypothetical protein FJY88_08410 [Candidatus Eisenbacteria bacterium]|nr:hypothetical protein [Candidatus Eisenbacteria bacterium]